ncbi:TPR repeat-containing protein [Candidatus Sulfopaludibacter sp. SbA3]|nr:TPR repeat-containing protein [Candidatus Sulfopaludibacter sp. SbA3]
MKFRNLALATAGLLVLAFTSLAQVTALEGDVKGTDGQPLKGAQIQIVRTDIKGNYPTKTDKKGHYIYTGLPIGVYNITVVVDGKEVDNIKGVRTSPGDPHREDFNLKAASMDKATKQAEMQKAVESGAIPKDLEKNMTPEQKAAIEKQIKDQAERMKKNQALNQAYNDGLAAEGAKNYDQAIELLNKAAELDPTQLAVWSHLAASYQGLAITKTGADFDSNMQKALDAFNKALALKPDDAGIHNNYALALAKDKKFPEAQTELQKAAQLDPPNGGKYYFNLGALLVNASQYDPAGEAFKKAIELTPTYADAYYQYGVCLSAKMTTGADGKVSAPPEMAQAFQKYLELAPTGKDAQGAKDMLAALGASIQTEFKNPDANKKKKKQ